MLKQLRCGGKKILNWLKKHGAALFIGIVIITTIVFCLYFANHWEDEVDGEIHAFLYFISGFATSAIFLGSWLQLKGINKKNKADFLLEIDKRWCSEEITAVRKELWTEYTKAPGETGREKTIAVQVRINWLLKKHETVDENLKENINVLFRHLNFIELLGAIHAGGYLDESDFDTIFGGKLKKYLEFYEIYLKSSKGHENSNALKLLNKLKRTDKKIKQATES